jgi:hypothetical protein
LRKYKVTFFRVVNIFFADEQNLVKHNLKTYLVREKVSTPKPIVEIWLPNIVA